MAYACRFKNFNVKPVLQKEKKLRCSSEYLSMYRAVMLRNDTLLKLHTLITNVNGWRKNYFYFQITDFKSQNTAFS